MKDGCERVLIKIIWMKIMKPPKIGGLSGVGGFRTLHILT